MLTTPDDPYSVVRDLQSPHSDVPGLLTGYYKQTGDIVSVPTNYHGYYHGVVTCMSGYLVINQR